MVEAAFSTGGVALIEAVEAVGVFLSLGVELLNRVAFRPERVADVPPAVEVAVVLDGADGGDVDDLPILAVGRVEDAAREVVLVPTGHNEQLARVVVQTGGEDGGVPVPYVLALLWAVGLHSVLHWVVDDGDVGGRTRQRAAHADGLEEARVVDHLEHLGVADIAAILGQPLVVEERVGEELLVLFARHNPLHSAVEATGEGGGVAGEDNLQVGVDAESPGGSVAADDFALAVLWRQRDHDFLLQPLEDHLHSVGDFAVKPLHRVLGVDVGQEVAEVAASLALLQLLQQIQLLNHLGAVVHWLKVKG